MTIADPEVLTDWARNRGEELGLKGIFLIAEEGINTTSAGAKTKLETFIHELEDRLGLEQLVTKWSTYDISPFRRWRVRHKKEIVTFQQLDINPNDCVGTYVKPKDWNALIERDDVVLLDTRNDYEYKVGTFEGAIDPDIKTFTEFKDFVREHYDPKQHKHVAMFCTGGIRCEKASGFMLQEGFENVYHLEGGILKYLEEVPEEQSLWNGECFVFDYRVTVDHQLKRGTFDLCYSCGWPISLEDKTHVHFEEGVSCAHCFGSLDEKALKRARARQEQVNLALKRETEHFGKDHQEAKRLDKPNAMHIAKQKELLQEYMAGER